MHGLDFELHRLWNKWSEQKQAFQWASTDKSKKLTSNIVTFWIRLLIKDFYSIHFCELSIIERIWYPSEQIVVTSAKPFRVSESEDDCWSESESAHDHRSCVNHKIHLIFGLRQRLSTCLSQYLRTLLPRGVCASLSSCRSFFWDSRCLLRRWSATVAMRNFPTPFHISSRNPQHAKEVVKECRETEEL